MNDPQETLHTLRREIKTLRLSDGNRTAVERPKGVETPVVPAVPAPSVVVIPETPGYLIVGHCRIEMSFDDGS